MYYEEVNSFFHYDIQGYDKLFLGSFPKDVDLYQCKLNIAHIIAQNYLDLSSI